MKPRRMTAQLVAALVVLYGSAVGVAAGPATPAAASVEAVAHARAGDLRVGNLRIGLASPSRSGRIVNVAGAEPLQCYDGWLQSVANGKYVAAELHYTGAGYGELRARSSSVGSWERFEFCWNVNNNPLLLAIRSIANAKWVSAEFQYTGALYAMLRARASGIGPWEIFNGASGLRAQDNWKFVSAELQYTGARYGMLRARASSYGPWEHFRNPGP
jgi:hypothetical protein